MFTSFKDQFWPAESILYNNEQHTHQFEQKSILHVTMSSVLQSPEKTATLYLISIYSRTICKPEVWQQMNAKLRILNLKLHKLLFSSYSIAILLLTIIQCHQCSVIVQANKGLLRLVYASSSKVQQRTLNLFSVIHWVIFTFGRLIP